MGTRCLLESHVPLRLGWEDIFQEGRGQAVMNVYEDTTGANGTIMLVYTPFARKTHYRVQRVEWTLSGDATTTGNSGSYRSLQAHCITSGLSRMRAEIEPRGIARVIAFLPAIP